VFSKRSAKLMFEFIPVFNWFLEIIFTFWFLK
jgi:hypothetical protein